MANTTNYNWETPDDTDLVKDGAAAIRTLGSSIDTTTKALNPSTTLGDIEYRSATANTNTRLGIGTTGQVLTVAGGVPTWATSDDANAIQNAIVDAKGDIVAASAADTPARLAVGTDNQRLVAASGEATGLKYVSDTQNTVIDAAGDLVYGSAADTLTRLAIGTAGQVLTVNAGATAPEWKTASSGSTFVGARAGRVNNNQTISNNTNTVVLWDSEAFQPNFDTDSIHSTTTNTGRFTVPTGKGGYWMCIATVQFESNGTGIRVGEFLLNTDLVAKGFRQLPSSASDTVYSASTVLKLVAGDYVEFRVLQNSGGSLAIVADSFNNQFVFTYLGA